MTHLITVPPELVREWNQEATGTHFELYGYSEFIATRAAQWGADMELKACCEWVDWKWSGIKSRELRAARRPKPPSLKEQALMALEDGHTGPGASLTSNEVSIIRRALEQLND
jgi:hypothetical protein